MPWRKQLVWLPEYSVGNPVLDAQHKKLQWLCHASEYYLGNQFEDQVERYNDILHDLAVFAREHFSTEELMLELIHYPALEEQGRTRDVPSQAFVSRSGRRKRSHPPCGTDEMAKQLVALPHQLVALPHPWIG